MRGFEIVGKEELKAIPLDVRLDSFNETIEQVIDDVLEHGNTMQDPIFKKSRNKALAVGLALNTKFHELKRFVFENVSRAITEKFLSVHTQRDSQDESVQSVLSIFASHETENLKNTLWNSLAQKSELLSLSDLVGVVAERPLDKEEAAALTVPLLHDIKKLSEVLAPIVFKAHLATIIEVLRESESGKKEHVATVAEELLRNGLKVRVR